MDDDPYICKHLTLYINYRFITKSSQRACFKGKTDCVEELLNLAANVEAEDGNSWTGLHFAARYGHQEIVELLLKKGAKTGKKVTGGPDTRLAGGDMQSVVDHTAADLAKVNGHKDIVDILVSAGDELSEDAKAFKDEDVWKDKPMTINCPQQ
jgi:ankyrin repeat protein